MRVRVASRATAVCLALLLCAAACVAAAPVDTLAHLPRGWERTEARVHDDDTVRVTMAVRQRNREALERTFNEVSDPDHERVS